MGNNKKMGLTYPDNDTINQLLAQPTSYSTMSLTPVDYRLGKKKDGTLVLQGKYHIVTVNTSTNTETYRYEWHDIETVDLDE